MWNRDIDGWQGMEFREGTSEEVALELRSEGWAGVSQEKQGAGVQWGKAFCTERRAHAQTEGERHRARYV